MNVLTVVGARPQFVKLEPLMRALAESGCGHFLVHTGQHWDYGMADIFFDELEIPRPDVNLGIGSAGHGVQTGKMLELLEPILIEQQPDWVVVFGDTNSTLAGAVTAAKLHIRVAHVEAGLRSWNRHMPEEVNRILTDHASNLLFAPTSGAVRNLQCEGIPAERIDLCGDIMRDAFERFSSIARRNSDIHKRLDLHGQGYVLATIHRAQNTDNLECLQVILDGLKQIAKKIPVVLPLHPRTRAAMASAGNILRSSDELKVIEPVGYLDMIALEMRAAVIATDSGGVQKEAFFARVPCVTIRNETEWTELVAIGWNRLCPPTNAELIRDAVLGSLGRTGQPGEPYGNGHTAVRIANILRDTESA
jgi:UDP-GlcNAc3NAcA epimerase